MLNEHRSFIVRVKLYSSGLLTEYLTTVELPFENLRDSVDPLPGKVVIFIYLEVSVWLWTVGPLLEQVLAVITIAFC